jgi:hypothetical protein
LFLKSISTPALRDPAFEKKHGMCAHACIGLGFALKSERQHRDDRPSIGASVSEPGQEHGSGFVGDSGERSDAHPVYEIESNFDVSHGAAFF